MFGPATDWGTQSVVISNGRQYTLQECSNWTMNGRFEEILKASQRGKDIPYDKIDRIEFETREVARGILDLQESKLWEILSQGMIIQEVALEGVQTAEERDEENFIKTLQVTTPSGVVTKVWSTPRKPRTAMGRLEQLATLHQERK